TYGKSASDIFGNPPGAPGGPPPDVLCRKFADLGVPQSANVDAISLVNPFLMDAPGVFPNGTGGTIGNIYAWSIDRASVGKDSGYVLVGTCVVVVTAIPSALHPELDETSSGESACGDIYLQVFDVDATGACSRINLLTEDESDLEEVGGVFGAPDLDNLDGLE